MTNLQPKLYKRIATRPSYDGIPQWQEGYTFIGYSSYNANIIEEPYIYNEQLQYRLHHASMCKEISDVE